MQQAGEIEKNAAYQREMSLEENALRIEHQKQKEAKIVLKHNKRVCLLNL